MSEDVVDFCARRKPSRALSFPTPLAWFLPGPECMRGGAARRIVSARHFHRGIQAESTYRMNFGKSDSISKACRITTLARWILLRKPRNPLAEASRAGIQPAESTLREAFEITVDFWLTEVIRFV